MADDYADIDIDAPTVEVIRANDAEIQRLAAELGNAVADAEQLRLATELVNVTRRQEGVLSEVPGLERRSRELAEQRAELERYYDLYDG